MSVLIRVLVCCFCFACLPVNAGSFKVYPLKLNFDAKTQTQLFRINNTGNDSVNVQLEAVVWSQDTLGEDVFEKTDDIIFFPKIVEVKAGEERVVRVAYRGVRVASQEKSYRLFAQELPNKSEASGALSFALRFSVPVFVGSRNMAPTAEVVSSEVKNGDMQVIVANRGSQHFIVNKIEVEGVSKSNDRVFSTQSKGWYVLPGSQRLFAVKLDNEACLSSYQLNNRISIGNKNLSKTIIVNHSQCRKIVEDKK